MYKQQTEHKYIDVPFERCIDKLNDLNQVALTNNTVWMGR